jgi:hypothetical protein
MRLTATLAITLVFVTEAFAQVPDHLKCFKVKDPLPKTTYAANLSGLVTQPGCVIRTPARLACVAAAKTNITPTPPGGGGTGRPNAFLCYKMKCPKARLPLLLARDQFGTRAVEPKVADIVCAPLEAETTTTTSSTTTTTLVSGICSFKGNPCTTDTECGIPGRCGGGGSCRHACETNADCTPSTFCFDAAGVGKICVGCAADDDGCSVDANCRTSTGAAGADCNQYGHPECEAGGGSPCTISDPCVPMGPATGVCDFSGRPCRSDAECDVPGVCSPEGDCRQSCATENCTAQTSCFESGELGPICVGCGGDPSKCTAYGHCGDDAGGNPGNDCGFSDPQPPCTEAREPCEIPDRCNLP